MKKSRAADALEFIRKNRGCFPIMLSLPLDVREVDLGGFKNPAVSPMTFHYRLGYLVGWLHGAWLIKIRQRPWKGPGKGWTRGASRLSITRAGLAFLREFGKEMK
jgi:hypothetical protein